MNIDNIYRNVSKNAERKMFQSVLINVLLFQVNIISIDWNTQKWRKNIEIDILYLKA